MLDYEWDAWRKVHPIRAFFIDMLKMMGNIAIFIGCILLFILAIGLVFGFYFAFWMAFMSYFGTPFHSFGF